MKTNELRIGNWVRVIGGHEPPYAIEGFAFDKEFGKYRTGGGPNLIQLYASSEDMPKKQ